MKVVVELRRPPFALVVSNRPTLVIERLTKEANKERKDEEDAEKKSTRKISNEKSIHAAPRRSSCPAESKRGPGNLRRASYADAAARLTLSIDAIYETLSRPFISVVRSFCPAVRLAGSISGARGLALPASCGPWSSLHHIDDSRLLIR